MVLARVAEALRPGGVIVLHEYFDYSTWRAAPCCPELEMFVRAVKQSWGDAGGEPDIALAIPRWLADLGFEPRRSADRYCCSAGRREVAWLRAFVPVNRRRLVGLGYLTEGAAEEVWAAFCALEAAGSVHMVIPGVLELIADRRP
jgi:hypothetical protein